MLQKRRFFYFWIQRVPGGSDKLFKISLFFILYKSLPGGAKRDVILEFHRAGPSNSSISKVTGYCYETVRVNVLNFLSTGKIIRAAHKAKITLDLLMDSIDFWPPDLWP